MHGLGLGLEGPGLGLEGPGLGLEGPGLVNIPAVPHHKFENAYLEAIFISYILVN